MHQLGGLFGEDTTYQTVYDEICVILTPERAERLGVMEDKIKNKLRRERHAAREQNEAEDLELVPPAPPAAEDEDASANDETPESSSRKKRRVAVREVPDGAAPAKVFDHGLNAVLSLVARPETFEVLLPLGP